MAQRRINPWSWQNQFGFSQGNDVTGAQRVLFCAGQASPDAEGRPVHAGDMRAQINQAFDNLETVLVSAGFAMSDVVRLNYYTTDVDLLLGLRRGHEPAGEGRMSAFQHAPGHFAARVPGTVDRDRGDGDEVASASYMFWQL